jgi:hypothetical protein
VKEFITLTPPYRFRGVYIFAGYSRRVRHCNADTVTVFVKYVEDSQHTLNCEIEEIPVISLKYRMRARMSKSGEGSLGGIATNFVEEITEVSTVTTVVFEFTGIYVLI